MLRPYYILTGATTLFPVNFSGYAGHATIFNWTLTIECWLLVGLELALGLWH